MSNKVKVAPSNKRAVDERKAALEQGLSITWQGKDYTVRMGDLTGLDTQALRREVGLSFIGVIKALQADPDIDLIAAIVWLSRRVNGERTLAYADVAADFSYDDEIDIADPVGDDDSGEA